jgi:DNA-binding response OmpR family regulator
MHGQVTNDMSAAIPHILVIDDNEAILDSVAMVLRWNALRVSTKNRMEDFKSDVYLIDPDCILLDKGLGWADGCDLCSELKTDTEIQHIPVIMFSALAQTKQTCLNAGANAFLEKPFDIDMLLQLVFSFTPRPVLPI